MAEGSRASALAVLPVCPPPLCCTSSQCSCPCRQNGELFCILLLPVYGIQHDRAMTVVVGVF